MKYEYMLHVWGGFWNPGNLEIHKEPYVEYQWFNTADERAAELSRLQGIAKSLGTFDSVIASAVNEGYLTRYIHVIQTVISVDGVTSIVERDLGFGFFSMADLKGEGCLEYFFDWKWEPYETVPENAEKIMSSLIFRKP